MKIFAVKDHEKRSSYVEFMIGKQERRLSIIIGKEKESSELKKITKQIGYVEKAFDKHIGNLRIGILKGTGRIAVLESSGMARLTEEKRIGNRK